MTQFTPNGSEQSGKFAILHFMNSPEGRTLRAALGGALLAGGVQGRSVLPLLVGTLALASGPLDFCPTNVALGYPLSGEETRRQLGREGR